MTMRSVGLTQTNTLKQQYSAFTAAKRIFKYGKKDPGFGRNLVFVLCFTHFIVCDLFTLLSLYYLLYFLILQEEASAIRSAGKGWFKTMISDSDYTEFENFTKWLGVTQ